MIALIAIAGGMGAVARYWVDTWLKRLGFKGSWSTAVINVFGAIFLGAIISVDGDVLISAVLGTGFCGGFTTFSTASVETGRLLLDKRAGYAFAYVVVTCVLSVCGVLLGTSFGKVFS
ncbi:fluoride efflux transporter FluC [Arcanobacterium buesumense]|uniref:Fluoride-specific ion channel FluC n=1 Tax=Arcanobacterium buesumense TaxID=2722751 RepID=A0A6H2ELH5_9ACTO|nr:CrcB family protein [Arcanobacterium buesumense]QJC21927.1 CrcB family protein [Arcanobacterium buesumense]